MEKTIFGNPLALLDEVTVHESNLPCRATKIDEAKFEPVTKGLSK
jgi:hypothetical protein